MPIELIRLPRFSVSQVSTLAASFADDVRAYARAGLDGIGIWEMKLGDGADDEALELLEASGLGAAAAVPAVPSILPLPLLAGPADPRARDRRAAGRSIRRLGAFRARGDGVPDRAGGARSRARGSWSQGSARWAREAERAGAGHRARAVPARRNGGLVDRQHDRGGRRVDRGGRVTRRSGSSSTCGICGTRPTSRRDRARGAPDRGVHVNDYRRRPEASPTASCPVTASPTWPRSSARSMRAGWSGFYDLEVFSDNGAWGTVYPDSLWDVHPADLLAGVGRASPVVGTTGVTRPPPPLAAEP